MLRVLKLRVFKAESLGLRVEDLGFRRGLRVWRVWGNEKPRTPHPEGSKLGSETLNPKP